MTKIENEKKNAMKKIITTNITTTKKEKKLTMKIENEIKKRELRNITNVEFLKRIKKVIEKSKNEKMKLK